MVKPIPCKAALPRQSTRTYSRRAVMLDNESGSEDSAASVTQPVVRAHCRFGSRQTQVRDSRSSKAAYPKFSDLKGIFWASS